MGENDDQAALTPFFAAARAAEAAPRTELLSTILGDAAEVSAARAPLVGAPTRRASPRRPGAPLAAPLAALGGWRAATALAVCAAIGFGLGLAGAGDVGGVAFWTGTTVATSDAQADPIADFYDLASTEG